MAAADIIDERGFAGLSLTVVAEGLGVRVPSLYKHIAGIDDLRDRLGQLAREQLRSEVQAAAINLFGREALLGLLRGYREYATAHPGRYAAFIGLPSTSPSELLARVIGECAVPAVQVPVVTLAVRSVIRGFVGLSATGAISAGRESDAVFAAILDLLDHGMLPSESRSRLYGRNGAGPAGKLGDRACPRRRFRCP
ncbi:MAG: TetR-like C-terminal domain-containing protein [Jatrophihabitantaceae bacterium]